MSIFNVTQICENETNAMLAIETSSMSCSVALLVNGQLISKTIDGARVHTEYLLPFIKELMAEAELHYADLDRVLIGAGPGAFTGVRVGFASAQAIAQVAGAPLIAVSSLAALAAESGLHHDKETVTVLIDARMGQLYTAEYQLTSSGDVTPMAEEELLDYNVFLTETSEQQAFIGTGLNEIDRSDLAGHILMEELMPTAVGVILAFLGTGSSAETSYLTAEPNYLRNDVAKKSTKKQTL